MEKLRAAILGEGAAQRRMAGDDVMQRGMQGGRVERSVEADDVGLVEGAVRLVAHEHGVENLALGLGGRRAVVAWEAGWRRRAALARGGKEAGGLHFRHGFGERAHDVVEVFVGVGGGEIKRAAFPGVHAFFPEEIPEQTGVFEVRRVFDDGVGAEVRDADRHADVLEVRVERAAEAGDALGHVDLQARAFAHEVLDDRPCRGHRERVTDEGAGEEGNSHFRETVIAVIPCAAVQGVHVFAFAGEHADGHAAADDLAVGGHVRLHAEVFLSAAGGAAEAGDDFVENERRAIFFRDGADFVHELARLQAGRAALHGLDHDGREFVGVGSQNFKRRGVVVVEHEDVFHERLRNAGRDRLGLVNAIHP